MTPQADKEVEVDRGEGAFAAVFVNGDDSNGSVAGDEWSDHHGFGVFIFIGSACHMLTTRVEVQIFNHFGNAGLGNGASDSFAHFERAFAVLFGVFAERHFGDEGFAVFIEQA